MSIVSSPRRRVLRTLVGLVLAPVLGAKALHGRVVSAAADPTGSAGTFADPFVGQIMLVPYTFAPRGWAFCEGQLLSIGNNQSLFSLLGTQYGGDGRTTVGLPDLRKAETDLLRRNGGARAYRHVIALIGSYPPRT